MIWDYISIVKPGSFIVSNASGFSRNPALTYIGTYRDGKFQSTSFRNETDRRVETDRELFQRGEAGSRYANYTSVLQAVYQLTGRTDKLVETYLSLRENAIQEQIERQKARWTDPERLQSMRDAGIKFGETDTIWTVKDEERVRSTYRDRAIKLELADTTLTLPPLPRIGFRPTDLDVYSV